MGRKWKAAACAAAICASAAGTLANAPSAAAYGNQTVIVTASGLLSPLTAVLSVGGSVLNQFHVINGVEASVSNLLLPVLEALPGITVTPDLPVSVQSSTTVSTGPHTPSDAFVQQTGSDTLARAGDTGQGVTVAVIDTGIDNLPDFAGRLVGGVDLTGAGQPFQDSYGHGTFVAGLIAGNGASSNGQYTGEATGANLVSVKVAGASGTTDIANVILGVQWVVDHASTYGIKVVNMSLGFEPLTSTLLNPVDMAVESAWNSGLTIVTSAGNAGPFNGTIVSPGDDPLAITVGALDDMGHPAVANDEMNDFSSAGPTSPDGWVKPDLVTSGRSVVSLMAPGSTIANEFPSAQVGSANFVGSGTSFSSAITAGAAALVLADNPGIAPNEVKGRLLGTTNPGPIGNPFVDGHGALNAAAAATGPAMTLNQSTLGEVAAAIGSTVSLAPTGPSDTWNANLWTGQAWNGQAWNGQAWNGYHWSGQAWNGQAWNGQAWNGQAWNGATWNGQAWNGQAWNGQAWNGQAWNGQAWNGQAWNGQAWNGQAWNGQAWN